MALKTIKTQRERERESKQFSSRETNSSKSAKNLSRNQIQKRERERNSKQISSRETNSSKSAKKQINHSQNKFRRERERDSNNFPFPFPFFPSFSSTFSATKHPETSSNSDKKHTLSNNKAKNQSI